MKNNKVGVSTNTIIYKSDLNKGNNKYVLTKEERKEAKLSNKNRSKKVKCYGCMHNKKNLYCLEKSKEIDKQIFECNKFKKI